MLEQQEVRAQNTSLVLFSFYMTIKQDRQTMPVSTRFGVPSQKRPVTSVTRLGDLLDFGQLFKAFGNT